MRKSTKAYSAGILLLVMTLFMAQNDQQVIHLPLKDTTVLPPSAHADADAATRQSFNTTRQAASVTKGLNRLDLDEELKKVVPPALRTSFTLRALYERDGILTANIFIRDLPLEYGDMKLQKKNGDWEIISGEFPAAVVAPKVPTFRYSEALEKVHVQLSQKNIVIKKSQPLAATWIFNENDVLQSCLNVEVEYETNSKQEHEKWCLNPENFKVERKTSLLKKF